MVYCGTPSKGCHTCRERKIRCDQRPEGCGNCAKSQRQCPGYRDQLDLMFRNETTEVTRKARTKAVSRPNVLSSGSAQPPPAPEDGGLALVRCQHDAGWLPLAYSYSFTPTVEERAERFFLTHYVVGMDGPSGNHSSNPTSTDMGKVLATSMKAVGLAGYASFVNEPELMTRAKKQYVAAIQLTNAALRSPVEAKKDSTLLTVMVLSLFEAITGSNEHSIDAWKNHLLGSSALLRMRGKEQLATMVGRRMFLQATYTLAVGCMNSAIELPSHIFELREETAKYFASDSPQYRFQGLLLEFTNFNARARQGRISDPEILTQALDFDHAFLSLFSNWPLEGRYETVYTDADPHIVFAGYYHVYNNWQSAQVWNGMRCLRMMLNELIREILLAGFTARPPRFLEQKHLEQFRTSTEALYQIQSDMLASVPQYMGYLSKSLDDKFPAHKFLWSDFADHFSDSAISPGGMGHAVVPAIRVSAGVLLPWNLYVAGASDIATEKSQLWVIEILHSLRRMMGIQQARVLAEIIERKMKARAQHPQ